LDDGAKLASATSDPPAFESLYTQLKRIALAQMARESPGHSWSPTVLVHELYLRSGPAPLQRATSKAEYFSFAAKAMRSILVDHARSRRAAKRGGGNLKVSLEHDPAAPAQDDLDIEGLDEALAKLESLDPQRAKLVELRFFGGCTMPECAEALGISVATAERWWRGARAWLYAELNDDEAADPQP
jgi:RNA polymerase sigma factor (TIGR02999 family)